MQISDQRLCPDTFCEKHITNRNEALPFSLLFLAKFRHVPYGRALFVSPDDREFEEKRRNSKKIKDLVRFSRSQGHLGEIW